ncbi:unnamed protein product [Brassica rapa subsp. narinosa]
MLAHLQQLSNKMNHMPIQNSPFQLHIVVPLSLKSILKRLKVSYMNLKSLRLNLQPILEQKNNTASLNSATILVDSQSTPITAPIMEYSPSTIINTEVCEILVADPLTTSPIPCAFESPSRFKVLGDVNEVETEPSSSLSLTKGGREIKSPIKYQNMEWKSIRGREKRGRGSYH